MKTVNAIVRKDIYEKFAETLAGIGVVGITATKCINTEMKNSQKEIYRGSDEKANYESMMDLEVVVPDDRVHDVVELLESIMKSDQSSKGKVMIKGMEDAIRIRDGQHGDEAL